MELRDLQKDQAYSLRKAYAARQKTGTVFYSLLPPGITTKMVEERNRRTKVIREKIALLQDQKRQVEESIKVAVRDFQILAKNTAEKISKLEKQARHAYENLANIRREIYRTGAFDRAIDEALEKAAFDSTYRASILDSSLSTITATANST